jgi:MOSC domain-containing protein YiiM
MTASGGRVVSIYVAPAAGAPMEQHSEALAVPRRGLAGDRYFDGTGAFSTGASPGREVTEVTLIEAEVIEHLRHDYGIDVDAADSRRNIVTRGVALNELVDCEFSVGGVRLQGAGLCEPCVSLVKSKANKHLLRGLAHKGGLRARILSHGVVAVGDAVATSQVHRSQAARQAAKRPFRGLRDADSASAESASAGNSVGRVGELAELACDEVRGLLADVDGVVADPFQAP